MEPAMEPARAYLVNYPLAWDGNADYRYRPMPQEVLDDISWDEQGEGNARLVRVSWGGGGLTGRLDGPGIITALRKGLLVTDQDGHPWVIETARREP